MRRQSPGNGSARSLGRRRADANPNDPLTPGVLPSGRWSPSLLRRTWGGDARTWDEGYLAGLLAAQASAGPAATAVAASTAAPVIEITVPEPRREVLFPLVPVGHHPARRAAAAPVARTPADFRTFHAAGPPPLGAAGPPPFSRAR